jgi:hypothetical protein
VTQRHTSTSTTREATIIGPIRSQGPKDEWPCKYAPVYSPCRACLLLRTKDPQSIPKEPSPLPYYIMKMGEAISCVAALYYYPSSWTYCVATDPARSPIIGLENAVLREPV